MAMNATRIRRERHRQDKIDLALATANLVLGGFSMNTDTIGAVSHMFTPDELERLRDERDEREQLALQAQQIERLRARYGQ